jgi:hypothetical protein
MVLPSLLLIVVFSLAEIGEEVSAYHRIVWYWASGHIQDWMPCEILRLVDRLKGKLMGVIAIVAPKEGESMIPCFAFSNLSAPCVWYCFLEAVAFERLLRVRDSSRRLNFPVIGEIILVKVVRCVYALD